MSHLREIEGKRRLKNTTELEWYKAQIYKYGNATGIKQLRLFYSLRTQLAGVF